MKDETAGISIEEFVGLRAKMLAMRYGSIEHKRAKGVKKQVVKNNIKFQHYKDILMNSTKMHSKMTEFRNDKLKMFTVNVNKISHGVYDDKRHLKDDGISCFAYGNNNILR